MDISKNSTRLLVLTRAESESPIVQRILEDIGWSDADLRIIEDLERPENLARLPINNSLLKHYQVYLLAQNYEEVLVTLWGGVPYYLLQSGDTNVSIFVYSSLLCGKSIGLVANEQELVLTELEEYVLENFRSKCVFYRENRKELFEHKLLSGNQSQDLTKIQNPSEDLLSAVFVYLPHFKSDKPLALESKSLRLTEEEYLSWVDTKAIPECVQSLADDKLIIMVDEGFDHLGLCEIAHEAGQAKWKIVAYDQKKAAVEDPTWMIPAIRSRRYFNELIKSAEEERYLGYGALTDFVEVAGDDGDDVSLSVVIVYHNRPRYLLALLKEFEEQVERSFEVVIVDNGSKEKLSIESLCGSDWLPSYTVKVISNMNSYPGLARNLGAQIAKGEHLVFFDDDNLPKPEFTQHMLSVGRDSNFDLTVCLRDLFVQRDGEVVSRGVQLCAPHLKFANYFRNYMGDNVFVMRRDLFLETLYSDFFEVGREDIEFLQYARERDLKLRVTLSDVYFYRLSNNDKIGNKHLTHRTREATRMDYGSFRKYYRVANSFTERKYMQLIDMALLNWNTPSKRQKRLAEVLRQRVRKSVAKVPGARSIYYRLKN